MFDHTLPTLERPAPKSVVTLHFRAQLVGQPVDHRDGILVRQRAVQRLFELSDEIEPEVTILHQIPREIVVGIAEAEDCSEISHIEHAEVEVHQFTDGHTIGKIETPEIEPIEGFTSLGWVAQAEDVSGKVDLAAETESEWTSEDTTFFGVYSRDASITYDGAGATDGMTEMSVGQQYYNASGAIGKASALLAQNGFERRGYSFATWSLGKPGETYEWEAKLEEPATKTALVTFDANGGEGEMAPQVMDLGVKTALSENAFKRAGFTFAGWNTAADGSGKAFADREEVLDLAKTGEEVTLFAQWSPVRAAPSPATNDPTPLVLIGILLVVAAVAIVVGVRSRRSRKE